MATVSATFGAPDAPISPSHAGSNERSRKPHDAQMDAFVTAKSKSASAIADLLNVKNTGTLDTITYRCLMRAHDSALLLGHRSVECLHLVAALAGDPDGRKRLAREVPGFRVEEVLKACGPHLLAELPRLSDEHSIHLPTSPELDLWIENARAKTADREEQNQAIEVRHLVAALNASTEPKLVIAKSLLSGVPTSTLAELIDASPQRAAAQLAEREIRPRFDALDHDIAKHATESQGRENWISHKIDVIHGHQDAHRAENQAAFVGSQAEEERRHQEAKTLLSDIRTAAIACEKMLTDMKRGRVSPAVALTGIMLAILLGGFAGWYLQP